MGGPLEILQPKFFLRFFLRLKVSGGGGGYPGDYATVDLMLENFSDLSPMVHVLLKKYLFFI